MKLALLADVHANLRALQACIAHARDAGATQFALLGDLVGYGAEPAQVVDLAMQLAAAGAIVLRGNHDEAVLAPRGGPTVMDATALWTRARLGEEHQAFLRHLPLTATAGPALLVHASAEVPSQWLYVDNAQRAAACMAAIGEPLRYVFCGHVHQQRLYYQGRGRDVMPFEPVAGAPVLVPATRTWVATVGSVGQPRDGDPRAMYALFDPAQARLWFHRVAYDHGAAADALRRTGQPEFFARRLQEGR